MHTNDKLKKTIYITADTLGKVQREVGLEICEGKKSSISKKLSDIVELHYTKSRAIKPLKTAPAKRLIVDISVLGNEFSSKDLQELYTSHGLSKRSAEIKIARLKKEGRLVVVGKGKYKLL